jgi:DNA-directed RNA polymerase specialized sigma24 family protein
MFWHEEAYKIAKKITNNHELHRDLVSNVFILLHKYELEADVLPKMFARFAWNQWNWRDSEFNRQFRFPANELTELADEQLEDVPNKYQELIHSFLNSMPKDDQELFIKEVTKMHLYGMTYREIKENTGLGLDTIHKTIKKFKHDLYFYSGGDCQEFAKLPVAERETI